MTSKTFSRAIKTAPKPPAPDQGLMGHGANAYVQGLHCLRNGLEQGIKSLDAGLGKEIDIESLITRANEAYDQT
jgi:hypothetical protein